MNVFSTKLVHGELRWDVNVWPVDHVDCRVWMCVVMVMKLYFDLHRLILSWWQSDRIRTSPGEGRLLRIQPGDLLTIGPAHVEVLERSTRDGPAGRSLQLNCQSESGSGVLSVTITDDEQQPKVVWNECGCRRELEFDDVRVWPRRDRT